MSETLEEKFRRAVALIQLLLSPNDDVFFEAEEEARQQLKAWGIKLPQEDTHHD